MVERTVTETIYEYDKQGNVIRKTVTETHEKEDNTTLTYPSNPLNPCPSPITNDWWRQPYVTWLNDTHTDPTTINTTATTTATN